MTQQSQPNGVIPRPAAREHLPLSSHEAPLKDVLVDLWHNLETLVRQELALARMELDAKAHKLGRELTASAVGGGLVLVGVMALTAAVILILHLVMAAWLAALLTGAVATAAGVVLLKRKPPSLAALEPERTIQNVKKDIQSFREATK